MRPPRRTELFVGILIWGTSGFSPIAGPPRMHQQQHPLWKIRNPMRLYATPEPEEKNLSDVDSRVLQSMLQDSKVDLNTEDDIRKLLERGTVKTVPQPKSSSDEDDDSEYDSSVLKAFTDTKLWKKLSTQASDVAESVGIWVSNKIESDVKVLAALGLFAWDRVVRDVGRALPAAGTSARKILLLANSSSYVEPPPEEAPVDRSVMEQMNKPADEIQAVSRAILDILRGDTTTTGRGLRTAAPAGTANMAERQKRAFAQRQKIQAQQDDVTRVPGAVVDTAYELGRELRVESNTAGYKSENVRDAIEAGIANTGNFLQGIQESARLAAAERKAARLTSAAPSPPLDPVQVQDDLVAEMGRIRDQLKRCIETPEETWLSADYVADDMEFDEDGLKAVVTMMIFVRDNLDQMEASPDIDGVVEQLADIRKAVEELRARVAAAASYDIAEVLWNEIFPVIPATGEPALTLRLDDLVEQLNAPPPPPPPPVTVEEPAVVDNDPNPPFWAKDGNAVASSSGEDAAYAYDSSTAATEPYYDVVDSEVLAADKESTVVVTTLEPEIVSTSYVSPDTEAWTASHDEVSAASPAVEFAASAAAEVVTDDDFEAAVGQAKAVKEVAQADEDAEKAEPNIATKAALRTLDVILFVLEKTLTVGLPRLLSAGKIASKRLDEISREGRGTNNWETLENAVNAKGRY